jgi:hypothetical protein
MPYIDPMNRYDRVTITAGELNYKITQACLEHLDFKSQIRYADLNEVIGVLESAKLELYRRLVGPYEDEAIDANGDLPLYASLHKELTR